MTEIMPVPRNLSFTVLPAGGLLRHFLFFVLHFMLPQPNIRNDLQGRLSLLTVIYPNLLKKSTKLSIIHGSDEEKCGIISKEFYKGVIDKL